MEIEEIQKTFAEAEKRFTPAELEKIYKKAGARTRISKFQVLKGVLLAGECSDKEHKAVVTNRSAELPPLPVIVESAMPYREATALRAAARDPSVTNIATWLRTCVEEGSMQAPKTFNEAVNVLLGANMKKTDAIACAAAAFPLVHRAWVAKGCTPKI